MYSTDMEANYIALTHCTIDPTSNIISFLNGANTIGGGSDVFITIPGWTYPTTTNNIRDQYELCATFYTVNQGSFQASGCETSPLLAADLPNGTN
jgi:hypothetical protein